MVENLEALYQNGTFKRGRSERADQAMADLLAGLREFYWNEFAKQWGKFITTMLEEFPDVSPYNLTHIELGLAGRRLQQERLLVTRLIAQLLPTSAESQCYLGHVHYDLGNYARAEEHYQRAYELAMAEAERKEPIDHHDPLLLDASDYLRHKAQCQLKQGIPGEAFVSLMRCLEIIQNAGDVDWKLKEPYRLLANTAEEMGFDGLARQFRQKSEAAPNLSDLWSQNH